METRASDSDKASSGSPVWTSSSFWTVPAQQAANPEVCKQDSTSSPTDSVSNTSQVLSAALGAVIRKHRLALGISQQTLAEEIGIDRGYLIGIEHSKRNPSVATLLQIAAGLNIRASELLGQAEQAIDNKP